MSFVTPEFTNFMSLESLKHEEHSGLIKCELTEVENFFKFQMPSLSTFAIKQNLQS
jgi:hypothetical protein